MGGDVIKSFLVGLGFGVDEASLAKFNKAITLASVKVAALYTSIQVAAAGIFAGISHMAAGFEEVGYQLRLVAPAINKFLILRQAMIQAYTAAGINLTKAVQQSILFNYSLAKTKFALEAVYKSVGIKFLPLLTKQMDIFRGKIFANMPKIQAQLTKMVTAIFKVFAATVELGERVWSILGRVWSFFQKLDEVTGGWSTKVLGLIAAWKILNLSFIATPLGMILTGLLAILALYDDFMVWKEGGKSFFDWGLTSTRVILGLVAAVAALPAILAIVSGAMTAWAGVMSFVSGVMSAFSAIMSAYRYIMIAVNLAMYANPVGLMIAGFVALIGIIGLVIYKWDTLKGWFSDFFSWAGAKLASFSNAISSVFGSGNAGPALSGASHPAPLLPAASGSNQKVNQETNINIQGSGDASAVGKAVASEQNKVNFDMTRNLKGALR